MKQLLVASLAFLLILLMVPRNAYGICNRVYNMAMAADSLTNKDKTGDVTALAADLLNEIKKRMDCVFKEWPLSLDRMNDEFRNHRIDAYAFSFHAPEFDTYADPVILYRTHRILLVSKKSISSNYEISDYLKDPNIKFAALSGASFFQSLKEIKKLSEQKRLASHPFPDGALDLFTKGKAQAMFTSPAYLTRYHLNQQIPDGTQELTDKDSKLDVVLYLSKKRITSKEREKFESVIEAMRQEGAMKKIILKYVSENDFNKYYTLDSATLHSQDK